MVDATDSKSVGGDTVRVRVPPPVLVEFKGLMAMAPKDRRLPRKRRCPYAVPNLENGWIADHPLPHSQPAPCILVGIPSLPADLPTAPNLRGLPGALEFEPPPAAADHTVQHPHPFSEVRTGSFLRVKRTNSATSARCSLLPRYARRRRDGAAPQGEGALQAGSDRQDGSLPRLICA